MLENPGGRHATAAKTPPSDPRPSRPPPSGATGRLGDWAAREDSLKARCGQTRAPAWVGNCATRPRTAGPRTRAVSSMRRVRATDGRRRLCGHLWCSSVGCGEEPARPANGGRVPGGRAGPSRSTPTIGPSVTHEFCGRGKVFGKNDLQRVNPLTSWGCQLNVGSVNTASKSKSNHLSAG